MKKILVSILAFVFILFCFASCNSLKHEHITDDKYSSNEQFHWKNVTCTWNWCKFDIVTEAHVDEDKNNICDVCGFEMPGVSRDIEWQYSFTHHWWLPEVEDGVAMPGVVYGYGEHIDEDKNNYCDVCECPMPVIFPEIDIEWKYSDTHHWWQMGDEFVIGPVLLYEEHKDENNDDRCDVCKYHMVSMIDPPPKFYFSKLSGVEWLETLKADEVAEIRMVSQASGVAPGSFRYISSSTNAAPIARILKEYQSLEVFNIESANPFAPGSTELTVEFILQDGTKKSLSFTQNIYSDGSGNHFGVTHIPTFNDVPEYTSYLGFVSYEPTGWVMAYSDGDAEVLRRVCTIPLDELEFTPCIITGGLPDQPTNYPYFVQTGFGDLVFLYNDLFYIAGKSECGYYQLVGKNLDELVGEYCEDVYSVTMNDSEWLYEDLKPHYEAGEQISVKIKIAYDLGYLLFVNGKKITPVPTTDTEYWEFIFTMPAEDVVIDFKTYDGFLPDWNYAVLIETYWEKIPAADSVSVMHYYGEYGSGAIAAMMVCSEYDYTEALWDEEIGNTVVHYNNGNRILVLYEGAFYTLTTAYNNGYLTDEDLAKIADLQKGVFPYLY